MKSNKTKRSGKTVKTAKSLPPSSCCCCDCTCNDEVSVKTSCCCCFPSKCGVIAIGLLTWLLTVIFIFTTLIWFMNKYFDWWFTLITLLLYIPLAISTYLFFKYFAGDQEEARGGLFMACILAMVSIFLSGTWIVIYFLFIYPEDVVYTAPEPWHEDKYREQTIKYYVWSTIVITVILILLYSYFLYFIIIFNERYDEFMKEGEEDMMVDDEEKKMMGQEEMDKMGEDAM